MLVTFKSIEKENWKNLAHRQILLVDQMQHQIKSLIFNNKVGETEIFSLLMNPTTNITMNEI